MNNKLVLLFITICLLLCCINANNENSFHSREYLDSLNDGLESFPRFESEWLQYPQISGDNIFSAVVNGFNFLNSFVKNVLSYPFRVIAWIFKMIGIILPNFVWWE